MSIASCPACGGSVDPATGICPQCATQINPRSGSPITATDSAAPSDAGAADAPEISGYRVINRLGEGGMGAVYLAEETTLGRRVAVKVISSRVAPDAQSKARFLREARTLATIEHPHVVRVYSFGEVEGRPYLAMEYVEGETLMDRIARLGKLSVDDALRITRDVVDALDAAWERTVIHRDIKPSNILIDRRNRVRVADFGLAKPKDVDDGHSALTLSGLMVGTPHYISPEQAQGKEVDFRSDFYSLGIMLFHMLTGERPFQGSTPVAIVAKHIHEPMPLAASSRGDIPHEIEQLIQWMTQKDVEKRPRSHQELLAALDGLITRTPTSPMAALSAVAVPAGPGSSLRGRIAGAAAVLLVILATSFFIWRSRRDNKPFELAATESKFVVAVAPFYGPDDDSAKEGRVMAALIERAVADRLGKENAAVLGIEDTKTAVRSHDEARELGAKLKASAVIWGEAFALRTETEIRPYVTRMETEKPEESSGAPETAGSGHLADKRMNAVEALGDTGAAPVKLEAEAPNQIELRKMSASGIGDVVLLLAGIHALETEKKYDKALSLFRQAPRTAETLRYEVQALLQANRRDEAQATLARAIALDVNNAASHALLGDLLAADKRMSEAIGSYQRAAALGQAYTTTRGIIHDGKLFLRETYQHQFQNDGSEEDGLALLAIDPVSQRVLSRWSLPGRVTSFRTEGETLVVGYDGGRSDAPLFAELRMTKGQFDRPIWPPPNFLWRVRSMRTGRVLAGNFLGEIDRPRVLGESSGRFRLRKAPAADLPATLPDLERALRAAADRDPTQPWHLLFLAITLREQKRMIEANAVIDELIRREYPHVVYFQYSWMLATLERLRYADWADRLYPKALAARMKLPQPPTFTVLIDRLINAPYVRQAAANRDIARGHSVLLRAREMTGITEAEDLVAAAWAEYFEARGDRTRAAQEWDVVRRTHRHPFNYLAALTKVDYAGTVTVATLAAFTVVLLIVIVLAVQRAGVTDRGPGLARGVLQNALSKLAGPVRAAVAGLFLAGMLLGSVWLYMTGALFEAVLVLVGAAGIFTLIRKIRVSPGALVASITTRERLVLLGAYLLFLAAAVVMIERMMAVDAIAEISVGSGDGMGHPRIIAELEQSLNTAPNDAMEYVAAVANHYGGNRERAEALYAAASGDYERKADNRAALQAGLMPAAPPEAEEFYAALRGPRLKRWSDVFIEQAAPAIALFGFLFLLLAFFAVRPRDAGEPAPITRTSKIASVLVPGLYDLRHEAPLRSLLTLLLLLLPIVPLWALLSRAPLGLGLASAAIPNLSLTFPLPSTAPDPFQDLKMTMRAAVPYARIYWGAVIVAGLAGTVLHLMRIPAILRERPEIAEEDQPTRVNVASVST